MIEFKGQRIFLQQVAVPKKRQIFSYVMDTRICDSAYKIADSADILVCESTYLSTETKLAENYKHLTARQAAEIAKKSKAKKLILTHFSQRYNISEVFEQEAKNIFKNTIAAIDGMEVEFEIIKRSV